MPEGALRTPLYADHLAANARIVEFAGWDMPVQYDSVIAEAKAVREHAGMFDVSHMARLILRGERVFDYLEHVTSNDVPKLADGTGQYSLLPNATGGLVDDIIVYRIHETEYRMVVNAANHAKDLAHLQVQNTYLVTIEDITLETAMIAVQGPAAVTILAGMSDAEAAFLDAPAFGVVEAQVAGVPVFAIRSGYTGEDGYELVCPKAQASHLWKALSGAGVKPCGLASRDTLRVEAGLPLYGHELSETMSPISAGLGWVIGKTKKFLGSDIINQARETGTPRRLVGVRLDAKRLTTPGMKVFVEGVEVGEVSSGVVSVVLECGIAFAFVDTSVKFGTPCTVEIRGKQEPATVVNKRFLKK